MLNSYENLPISSELDLNLISEKIELLDKEWESQLPNFMEDGKLPDLYAFDYNINHIVYFTISLILLIVGLALANAYVVIFTCILLVLLTLVVAFSNNDIRKIDYENAKKSYEREREKLLKMMY